MKSLSCHEWIIYLLKPNTGRHLYIRTTVSAAHLTLDRCNDYFAVISSLIWSRSWASAWEWGPAGSCQTAALAASWSLTKHRLHCNRPRTYLAHILPSEEIIQSCHASAKWTVDRHLVTNREVVTWKYFIVQTDCFPDKILQRIVSVQWLRRWMFTNNKDIVWQGYYFW